MAFLDFPSQLQVKVLGSETNNAAQLGSFTMSGTTELNNIRLCLVKHGPAVGGEVLRVKLALSNDVTRSVIVSSDVALSDVSTDDYFVGWVKFDFERQNLDPNLTYFAFLEYENYVRDEETFYLAYSFDDVFGVNNFNASDDFGAAMQILGYK